MRIIKLEDATLEWLEQFYARFQAVHMERSIKMAQRFFVGEALDMSVSEITVQPHYVQIQSTDELGAQTLRLLIGTQIISEGKTFVFGTIQAEIDGCFPEGETPDRWLEIGFRPA